jgi:thymidylate kinase
VLSWLVRTETRMYAEIPPPDVVFHLWAPLEVTLQRNRDREKTEPEELVTLRHRQTGTIRFDGCPVHRLDTTRPLGQSVQDVRDLVSRALARPEPNPGRSAPISSI